MPHAVSQPSPVQCTTAPSRLIPWRTVFLTLLVLGELVAIILMVLSVAR